MSTEMLLVIGAGGHAKVVIDALQTGNNSSIHIALADDDPTLSDTKILGIPVVMTAGASQQSGQHFHIAIGSNRIRERKAQECLAKQMIYANVLHPGAFIALSATVKAGCFVAAGAIVGPDAVLGDGCIINHGAVVDHDCCLSDYCHIAPNATLGGNVKVGACSFIGAGANVLPGVVIAADCVVGAGAVVLHDLPEGTKYVGVPARRIKD